MRQSEAMEECIYWCTVCGNEITLEQYDKATFEVWLETGICMDYQISGVEYEMEGDR